MQRAHLEPLEPFSMVTAPWKYRCVGCGRESTTTLHRVKQGSGCPYCGGTKVDLQEVLARMTAAHLEPLEPYVRSNAKWRAIHIDCGSEVSVRYADIRRGQGGCTYCRYDKIAARLRMSTEKAESFIQAAGGKPLEPFNNIHSPWRVLCSSCGREANPMLANVMRGQGICLACRPKPPVVTEQKALAYLESKNLQPLEPYRSAHSPWRVKCIVCKKVSSGNYSAMRSKNIGCVYCSNSRVDAEDVYALFGSMGFEVLGEYENARKAIPARCLNCQKVSRKRYDDLRVGKGCQFCSRGSIDLSSPTYFYIVHHLELGALKIGIGNFQRKQDRLAAHRRKGWLCLFRFNFEEGFTALNLERELLHWLREELRLPYFLTSELMPQGGFTETFDAQQVTFIDIRNKFDALLREMES